MWPEAHSHRSEAQVAYDALAEAYVEWAGTEVGPDTESALDRAVLAAFVEDVVAAGRGAPVADVGCGPGRVAALMAAAGLDVVGIDLSPTMVEVARRSHPSIRFEVGSLDRLPFGGASLSGAVCWYSIIHTPPDELAPVAAELARVLAPGAPLLVAFQAGSGESIHRDSVAGVAVSLTNVRHDPDAVAGCLEAAGFDVRARIIRQPELEHESTPQAFLVARA